MTPLILTPREWGQLEVFTVHAPSARECRRAQALLWLAHGDSVDEIAERLQVARQTVYNWADRFLQRQGDALGARLADGPRCGRPATALGIIDPLVAEVIDQDPRTWGYRATTWTASLLREYLRDVQEVEVSRKSVSRALARLRLRWKRPRHGLARRPDTWRQAKGGLNAGFPAENGQSC
jgi:transposase